MFGVAGIGSPSLMLYQSMMKVYPLTLITEIVGKSFYSMQKARGIDFEDAIDGSKYQALDSLYLNKTKSGQKRAMKKMALLNIKESIDLSDKMGTKSQSEQRFLNNHHEFWRTDDDLDDEEDKQDTNSGDIDKDYMQVIEEFASHEPKLWDCYQLFCKLINYKYNPYDDQEIEDYLTLQEVEGEQHLQDLKENKKAMGSMWHFSSS
jgi:hypothetical protein